MANTPRANGLRPISNLNGAAWTGRVSVYSFNGAGACGRGTIVQPDGSANADGIATVDRVAGNNIDGVSNGGSSSPMGVVVGWAVDATNLDIGDISAPRLVYVVDDPNAMFEIQEDSNGGQLALASVGLNADLTAGSVERGLGIDTVELDTSTVGAGASLPVKILGFVRRLDNEVSTSYAKVVVKFNSHWYGQTSTGI